MTTRKIFSFLLALAICISSINVVAFAESTTEIAPNGTFSFTDSVENLTVSENDRSFNFTFDFDKTLVNWMTFNVKVTGGTGNASISKGDNGVALYTPDGGRNCYKDVTWSDDLSQGTFAAEVGSTLGMTSVDSLKLNIPANAYGEFIISLEVTEWGYYTNYETYNPDTDELDYTYFATVDSPKTYTTTVTVAEPAPKPEETFPYEIYYELDSNTDNVTADYKDYKISDDANVETNVTAKIKLKNNTDTNVTLQAYDIYLEYGIKDGAAFGGLKYSGENMGGAAYIAGADITDTAEPGQNVTHIEAVGDSFQAVALNKNSEIELGTVTFTIDKANVQYGQPLYITLTQGSADQGEETTNISIANTATVDTQGDTTSYYPKVTGTTLGAEVVTTYEVKYEDGITDEEIGVPNAQSKEYNKALNLNFSNVGTRDGYSFLGWSETNGSKTAEYTADGNNTYTKNAGTTLYAVWEIATVNYTVYHMQEKLDGSGYEVIDRETLSGQTGTTTNAVAKTTYDGFTAQAFTQSEIAADGSTVVEIKYNRNSYTLTWNLDNGTAATTIEAKYGAAITALANPQKTGYIFADWDQTITTMPANDVTITAKWTPITYTIVFDGNGSDGGSTSTITATYDQEYTLTNGFTKTGHTFVEWNTVQNPTDATLGMIYSGTESVKNLATTQGTEVKLYAQWKENTYTVKFNSNNGSGKMNDQTFTYTEEKALSSNGFTAPSVDYIFAGWATSADSNTVVYTNGATVKKLTAQDNGVVDLYAVWVNDAFAITYTHKVSNETVENFAAIGELPTVYYNTQGKTIQAPTATGYTFAGWTSDALGITTPTTGAAIIAANSNKGAVDLTAHWTINQYTITFAGGEGAENMPENITGDYKSAVTAPTVNPTKTGYTFAGWDKEIPATMPGDNMTITAQWTINKYTITFEDTGDTEIPNITEDYGTTVTKPEDPTKEGYTFAGWDVDGDGETDDFPATMPHTDAVDKIITIAAIWTEHTYNVSYDRADGVAYDSSVTDKTGVKFSEKFNLPEAAKVTRTGYTLTGWTMTETDIEGSKTYTPGEEVSGLTANDKSTVTLTPVWTPITYTIAFNSNEGAGEMANITDVAYDQKVTLTANAFTRNGYSFTGWATTVNGPVVYENSAEVSNLTSTADATFTLYAVWTPVTYQVTLVVPEDTQYHNTTVNYDIVKGGTLPTPSNGLFTFKGWKVTTPYGNWTVKDELINTITHGLYGSDNESENVVLTAEWGFEVLHDVEDYKYAYNTEATTGGYVMLRVADNLNNPAKEYKFGETSMYYTTDPNYLLNTDKTSYTGVFFLLIGEEYFDSTKNALNAEGEKLLKAADAASRTTLLAEGENKWDINGDSAVNIADANIVYQMVQNGGAYYSYSDGQNDGQLDNKHRLMADLATARDDDNNVHRASIMDVNEIVSKINGKTN